MKRVLSIFALCVCAVCSMQAQTIKQGDKFFDGSSLWTVEEIRMGKIVYMTNSHDGEITLEKVAKKAGEYKLIPSRQADEPLFRGVKWGCRVQYVRQEGMYFLAFRKANGDAIDIMYLTPDSEEYCLEQQEEITNKLSEGITSQSLINRTILFDMPKDKLRILRNEIMARHGYRFQAKDLQEYFGKQSWYHPGKNNNAIKLSVIEQINMQIIKSEEADRE